MRIIVQKVPPKNKRPIVELELYFRFWKSAGFKGLTLYCRWASFEASLLMYLQFEVLCLNESSYIEDVLYVCVLASYLLGDTI